MTSNRSDRLPAPPCTVAVQSDGDGMAVVLQGELDLAGADAVDAVFKGLSAAGHHRLQLDLGALEFLDSSGLRVILSARRHALGAGGELVVTRASTAVERILEVTGLLGLLVAGCAPDDRADGHRADGAGEDVSDHRRADGAGSHGR